jgi:hypothetical protein
MNGIFYNLHYIHTIYNTSIQRFIPEEVVEIFELFLWDTHIIPKLLNYYTTDVTSGKSSIVWSHCMSDVNADTS